MSHLTHLASPSRRNPCELLLRDVACLLITSQRICRSVKSLRPGCSFSPELMDTLDSIIAANDAGERLLPSPLGEPGVVLPNTPDASESALLADFFIRLPACVTPGTLAAEVAGNLRLLARHVELKARLAAGEALLAGQNALCQALMLWAAKWRCATTRAQAYVTGLHATPAAQTA